MQCQLSLQVDIQLLQKDLTSDASAMSTNLTSFHQYDDTVSLTWEAYLNVPATMA